MSRIGLGLLGGPAGVIGFGVSDAQPPVKNPNNPATPIDMGLPDNTVIPIEKQDEPLAPPILMPPIVELGPLQPPSIVPAIFEQEPPVIIPVTIVIPVVTPGLQPVQTTPGTSCDTAGQLFVRTSATVDMPANVSHWWTFSALAGITYHVRVVQNSGPLGSVTVSTGTCGGLTTEFVILSFPGCNTLNKLVDSTVYILVTGNAVTTVNYTIQLDTGGCP